MEAFSSSLDSLQLPGDAQFVLGHKTSVADIYPMGVDCVRADVPRHQPECDKSEKRGDHCWIEKLAE